MRSWDSEESVPYNQANSVERCDANTEPSQINQIDLEGVTTIDLAT